MSDRPAALPDGRTQARRIITAQVIVSALLAATFLVFDGMDSAKAALVGGLINVVANLYFAHRLYGGRRGRIVKSAVESVLGFYVGEAVKLFITLALFALAIGVFKLSFLPLFTAFVATLLVFWLALAPGFNRLFGDRA